MYLFLDFDNFVSCRLLMNDELRACDELNDCLRKLYHNYENELDSRADTVRQLYKRASELEETLQRRQDELSRIVEELAGTYADCDRIITEAREAAKRSHEKFEFGVEG